MGRVLKSSVVCRVSGLDGSLRFTFEKEIRKSRSVDPRAAEKKRSSSLLAVRERLGERGGGGGRGGGREGEREE